MSIDFKRAAARARCEQDHLFFTRYFFKHRHNLKFKVNWHHIRIADAIDGVFNGAIKNLVINVAPGSSKTELVVINMIARGLALNPRARFLHLSYSDDLALLNSQNTRELIQSDEYQSFWPRKIADDSSAKKRWNVMFEDKEAGGVYATSLGGQITGFRAGHMAEGFQGAIIIDDPLKPEDAFSKPKLDRANRQLLTTVKSRRATPNTPIIIIMQRIAESDPTGFIRSGNLQGEWEFVTIPAVLDKKYVAALPKKYRDLIESEQESTDGRISYWPYKEPIADLLAMERGEGQDQTGSRISRHVFASQYQQSPVALGGNLIKGEFFVRYKVLPKIMYRRIYVDTAQKTKEHNDFSVFACYGMGSDGRLYLLDLIRGKWEAPELEKRAIAFWTKLKVLDIDQFGQLREMVVEDKVSGTGLIQSIRLRNSIPIRGLERNKDKLTRLMDAQPYIEARQVCIPEEAPYTADFISEFESFSPEMTHDHDDQVDTCVDAVNEMLSTSNKLKQWESLA